MIKPFQHKLIEAAVTKLDLGPADLAHALGIYGGAACVGDLSQRGYERLMDYFTVIGFRDRRRPIATVHTCRLAHEWLRSGFSDGQIVTLMHRSGISDFRDLDGYKFLAFLVDQELQGLTIEAFHASRRDVTPAQLRLLQVARKQLDVADSRYLPMLQTLGAVNTASDLDQRGFDLCMMWMEIEGFDRRRIPAGEADIGKRQGFASDRQLRLIRTLWAEWSGGENEAALNAWIERYHRVSTLRFLTTQTAAKVIGALRTMKRRSTPHEKASA